MHQKGLVKRESTSLASLPSFKMEFDMHHVSAQHLVPVVHHVLIVQQ